VKARDVLAAVFARSGGGLGSRRAPDAGLPASRLGRRGLLMVAAAALLALLVLGVALAGAAAPVVSIEPAGNVQFTTAHVEGEVDPEDHGTSFHFEYATQAQFEASEWGEASAAGFSGVGAGEEPVKAIEDLSGLAPGTTYHLRLVAENEEGERREAVAPTFTTEPVAKPSVTIDPVSGSPSTSASFSGTVDANAPASLTPAAEAAYRTEWHFECEPSCSGDLSGAIEGEEALDPANNPHTVSGEATGLEPNKTYTVKLVASNAGGSETASEAAGQPVTFTTPGTGPDISPETLWEPTSVSIQLNANVNAHNSPLTDCHFEYGTTVAYGQSAPCESPFVDGTYEAPVDNSDNLVYGRNLVSARISGLQSSTEYHFRLVATNAFGKAEGADRSVTTLAAQSAESCPNQAIREQQHATDLPDCRAYEMVTPLEKGHGDVVADGLTTISSKEGGAVAYSSRTPFGDTIGSGVAGQTQYVARREAGDWATHAITPRPRPYALQTLFAGTHIEIYSDDLSRAILQAYDLPDVNGDTPDRDNIYAEETATRSFQPLTTLQANPFFFSYFAEERMWGVSADARHVALETPTALLPDAAANVPNVYQSDDGVLSLAGILPNGEVPAAGSRSPENYRGAMSADGSRLAFTASAGGPDQLYLRIDGNRTVWISQPEGSETAEPSNVHLEAMTPDGRNVLFVTDSPLLDEDTNSGPDLYRYRESADPASDQNNLTLITHAGDVPAEVSGNSVVGVSDDGERIYINTASDRLELWNHGVSALISPFVAREPEPSRQLTVTSKQPGYGRVTSDGSYLAFVSEKTCCKQDQIHGLTGRLTSGHFAMYLFDIRNDTLRCVSCTDQPPTNNVTVTATATDGSPTINDLGSRPRFLSEEGNVFFATAEALVSRDVNGIRDTYEYSAEDGSIRLLSSGAGKYPTTFADASASGHDVILATRQPLASGDSDEFVDLYDARQGGGFPAPPVGGRQPSCGDEACQGPSSSPPSAPAISSRDASRQNIRPPCPRGKRRAVHKGRSRCQRRHKKLRHHRASHDRRVSR